MRRRSAATRGGKKSQPSHPQPKIQPPPHTQSGPWPRHSCRRNTSSNAPNVKKRSTPQPLQAASLTQGRCSMSICCVNVKSGIRRRILSLGTGMSLFVQRLTRERPAAHTLSTADRVPSGGQPAHCRNRAKWHCVGPVSMSSWLHGQQADQRT
jgi:hypothetical protein